MFQVQPHKQHTKTYLYNPQGFNAATDFSTDCVVYAPLIQII